jgi:hypothetical protein
MIGYGRRTGGAETTEISYIEECSQNEMPKRYGS